MVSLVEYVYGDSKSLMLVKNQKLLKFLEKYI